MADNTKAPTPAPAPAASPQTSEQQKLEQDARKKQAEELEREEDRQHEMRQAHLPDDQKTKRDAPDPQHPKAHEKIAPDAPLPTPQPRLAQIDPHKQREEIMKAPKHPNQVP